MREVFSNVQAVDMKRNQYNTYDQLSFELIFDDQCPICKFSIDMGTESWLKFHDISYDNQKECNVACIHYCPHCHNLFLTEHKMYISDTCYQERSRMTYPIIVSESIVSDEIKKVSRDFVNIYNQALLSKQYGLFDVYGMALRKAFECLVKDFALYNNPDKEGEIAKKSLSNCIKYYIQNSKINTLCTSCRLIGNNETHWKNSNSEEDVVFMEKVLKAVMHFIEQEIVVSDAKKYNATHRK